MQEYNGMDVSYNSASAVAVTSIKLRTKYSSSASYPIHRPRVFTIVPVPFKMYDFHVCCQGKKQQQISIISSLIVVSTIRISF